MNRTQKLQFEIMVAYMERGDLSSNPENDMERFERISNWRDLTSKLNSVPNSKPKSTVKWRKIWSDYKNNIKKKAIRMRYREGGVSSNLTTLEKRVLIVIGFQHDDVEYVEDPFKDETASEMFKSSVEEECTTSSPMQYNTINNDEPKRRTNVRRSSSSSSSSEVPKKKHKEKPKDEFRELTLRYLQFEQEKNRMKHEEEMARLKQNDKWLSILDRMVNVVEAVAPSVKGFFDRESNGKG